MRSDIDIVKRFVPESSVTNKDTPSKEIKDRTKPFSYITWLQHVRFETTEIKDYTAQYNAYLKEWAAVMNKKEFETLTLISDRYKDLLRDITLNYSTAEEKRFLANIDYTNSRHVESALPFYVSKIKQISLYISRQRDTMKQQKVISSYAGSTHGVVAGASKSVLNRSIDPTKINTTKTETDTEPYFNVSVVELYDFSEQYFKQNKLPFTDDTFKQDAELIQQVLQECQPVLKLNNDINIILSSPPIDINPTLETQAIDYSEFFNYTKHVDNLNVLFHDQYMGDRLGKDIYKLDNNSLTLLKSPEKPWRNLQNRVRVVNNNRHQTDSHKSVADIGGYFTPQNTGLLTFFSYKPQYIITDPTARVNVLQDVNKHGNSVWSDTTGNPIDHYEDVTWIKFDIANGTAYGDIVSNGRLATFSGYTSNDEVQNRPQQGVSRSTDALGFFDGKKNETWANEDVFPVDKQYTFDIDGRQKTLIVGHNSVYRWRTDIFGNEYALYKKIQPERGPFDVGLDDIIEYEQAPNCEVIDCGESLKTNPHMYEENVDVEIFEGGRTGGSDPKVEQYDIPIPFPDLRRVVDVDENGEMVKEDWNTAYHGLNPTAERPEMGLYTPITYHGFAPNVTYDRQAYCGLFTDDICGRIVPERARAAITDNYSFNVYTEQVGEDVYQSASYWASSADAFDEYLNPIPQEYTFDESVGFSNYGIPLSADVELIERGDIDGTEFTNDIFDNLVGDFFHAEESETYFNTELEIGETKYSDEPEKSMTRPATLYEQRDSVGGTGWFRSYNSSKIQTFSEALKNVIDGFKNMEGDDYKIFKDEIDQNNIIDIDVLYDVMVIETKDYIFIDKVNFDAETSTVLPTGTSNIFIRTTGRDPLVERSIGWFFNEQNNELIFGRTRKSPLKTDGRVYDVVVSVIPDSHYNFNGDITDTHNAEIHMMLGEQINFTRNSIADQISILNPDGTEHVQANSEIEFKPELPGIYKYFSADAPDVVCGYIIVDSEDYVYPEIYTVDLNTLKYRQSHPNKNYKQQLADQFKLPAEFARTRVHEIDRPVLTYNDVTGVYNVSYSAKLVKGRHSRYTIFSADYRMFRYNWKLMDNYMYHSDELPLYVKPGEDWDEPVVERLIKLRPDESMLPRTGFENTSRTESLSAMIGYPLSGYTFDLSIDTKTIPVGLSLESYKINRLIFDPGDGTQPYVNDRVMDDGLQPLTFDLTELPDPSDFGDPRRFGFEHTYVFDKSEPHVYTAKVQAIYSDYTTATYNIDIETMPYSVESGLGGAKLIDTKLFTDVDGKDRQLLVIETQNPRYVTNVIVDRNNGVVNIISGYVDGARYKGPYHLNNEGHPMTGEQPSDTSKKILRVPVIGNASPEPADIPRSYAPTTSNMVLPSRNQTNPGY